MRLKIPLKQKWKIELASKSIAAAPIIGEDRFVVGAYDVLFCGELETGSAIWEHKPQGRIEDVTAIEGGVVTNEFREGERVITAWTWEGKRLWSRNVGRGPTRDSLRGNEDKLVVLVDQLADRNIQKAQVRSASDGKLLSEFEDIWDLPDWTEKGLLYGLRGDPDISEVPVGLFLQPTPFGETEHFSPVPHTLRVLTNEYIVVQISEPSGEDGDLAVLSLDNANEIWRHPGGPNSVIDVKDGEIAAFIEGDGDMGIPALLSLSTGEIKWRAPAQELFLGGGAMLMENVAVFDLDGNALMFCDRETGSVVERHEEFALTSLGLPTFPGGMLILKPGLTIECYAAE